MSNGALPPLKSVVYLVVLREQNARIIHEFANSLASLRRLHPDVQVMVYHHNLNAAELAWLEQQPNTMGFPIGVDCSGRFEENRYLELHDWRFPELFVLAAKIDTLLLTPGDSLFLDTDTEVHASLDDVFRSQQPWMHLSEGLLIEHERDYTSMLETVAWDTFGWGADRQRLTAYNSGSIYVPQTYKHHLYKAKEFLWCLAQLPAQDRGDNRLDEQIAVSIALQESVDYELSEVAPRVYHYWEEKYLQRGDWYERVHGVDALDPLAMDDDAVLFPLC